VADAKVVKIDWIGWYNYIGWLEYIIKRNLIYLAYVRRLLDQDEKELK
jgi:hypothetical protein